MNDPSPVSARPLIDEQSFGSPVSLNSEPRDMRSAHPPIVPPDRFSNAPEVVPEGPVSGLEVANHQSPVDPYGRNKLAAPLPPAKDEDPYNSPIPVDGEKQPRTYCGLSKKWFLIIAALVTLVVIGAVVGGAVGGTAASNSGGGDDSSDSDSSSGSSSTSTSASKTSASSTSTTSTSTSSNSSPTATGPIDQEERGLAAAISADSDTQDIQVFYQDTNTQDIYYVRVQNDEAQSEHNLHLDITAIWGSPLAAATLNGSDPLEVQLFYLAYDDDSDNKLSVARAYLECDTGSDTCSLKNNNLISTGSDNDVNPDTDLAALRIQDDDNNDFTRVYYQIDGDNDIWVFQADNSGSNSDSWKDSLIVDNVWSGSSIAASAPNATDIHLYWISKDDETLQQMIYSDADGPEDPYTIDDSPESTWGINASLTATYVPNINPYRVFYAEPDNASIVGYFWNATQPTDHDFTLNHDPSWGLVTGFFEMVAWADQVRVFYFQDATLTMSKQDVKFWSTGDLL